MRIIPKRFEPLLIWLAAIVAIAVVVTIGTVTFRYVESPVWGERHYDSARPWVIDENRPWTENGSRPFDYGTVPFVPAKSHYSSERVTVPPLPNPNAINPPPNTTGGGR